MITPVEQHGDIFLKRDDLFTVAGISGGKVRTCNALAEAHKAAGKIALVTASSRTSPQANIVASIARHLSMMAVCHIPTGKLGPELEQARDKGAIIVQHTAGYNSVICARANSYAVQYGAGLIPFGMECQEAVDQTRKQVWNLQDLPIKRIVVPVGSGMSLAGILHGLVDCGLEIPVVGVTVGADPTKRLDRYANAGLFDGPNWRTMATLVPSGVDYAKSAKETMLGDLQLDPYYEAKCLPFLLPGDLFWIVGIRPTLEKVSGTV